MRGEQLCLNALSHFTVQSRSQTETSGSSPEERGSGGNGPFNVAFTFVWRINTQDEKEKANLSSDAHGGLQIQH